MLLFSLQYGRYCQLRRVLRQLEQPDGQVYMTYHVLFALRRKPL